MSKIVAKKRSSVREQSLLQPPKDFDNKKFAGRWVSDAKLNARSDGFESRGFSPWKNKDGNIVKVGDLVWCYMTREDADLLKQEKYEAAVDSIKGVQANIEEQDSRLSFELERAGGKLQTTITMD